MAREMIVECERGIMRPLRIRIPLIGTTSIRKDELASTCTCTTHIIVTRSFMKWVF